MTNLNFYLVSYNKLYERIAQNLDDESKLIITFKLTVQKDKPLNLKHLFPSAVIILRLLAS